MFITIIVLFSACIILDFYTVNKILNKRDLNLFDFLSFFHSIYFILIPIRNVFTDTIFIDKKSFDIVTQSQETVLYLFLFKLILLLINIFITSRNNKSLSYFNVTKYIKLYNSKIKLNHVIIYLYLAIVLFVFTTNTNFNGMNSNDEISINTLLFKLPWYIKFLYEMASNSLPVIAVLSLKYNIEVRQRLYKNLSYLNLLILFFTFLFNSRTLMFFSVLSCFIYIYSIYRNWYTKSNIIKSLLILFIGIFTLFPFVTSLRTINETIAYDSSSYSLTDVLIAYSGLKTNEMKSLLENSNQTTEARSLGLFYAFNKSVQKEYESTKGGYTLNNFSLLIPFLKPSPEYINFTAKILDGGGDMAESPITVFNVDLGLIGIIFISPIYYLILFHMLYLLMKVINSFFHSAELNFLLIFVLLRYSCNLENFPSFRDIYNPYFIVFVVYALVFEFFKNFIRSKKISTKYNLNKSNKLNN